MTDRERAEQIVSRAALMSTGLLQARELEKAIAEALAEERERAAQLIDAEVKTAENDCETSDFIKWLEGIARAIRGRGGEE